MLGGRIVISGATGSVGLGVALDLAKDHSDVWAVARFSDPGTRKTLEDAGIRCVVADLAEDDLSEVPDDADYVLNFAVAKTGDWGKDLDGNAGGVGALMHRCRSAQAFFHCSTTAVYQPGPAPFTEQAPLGDNHRVWPHSETYSITKIAAEAMARFGARHLGIPTTIARLNVPYGACGGWPSFQLQMMLQGQPIPIHPDDPNLFNPIHTTDIAAMIPKLIEASSVPATLVNWGGVEAVGIQEWCNHLGEVVGVEPTFLETEHTIRSVCIDTSLMESLVGATEVHWRDGMRQMATELYPEQVARTAGAEGRQ